MSELNGHNREHDDPGKLLSYTQQQAGGQRHLRRDCMDITRMLGLGVISPEKIQDLLKKTGDLLELNLDARDSRAVMRLWGVLQKAAQLEQNERHKFIASKFEHTGPDGRPIEMELSTQAESRAAILNDPDYLYFRDKKRLAAIPVVSTNGHHETNGHAKGNGYHE
jgi:hypothetical protein